MNNSLWISSGEKNKIEFSKLEGELEAEITIIGGGLTGLTTAYYLTKAGKKVILLEKDKICNHTSGNTTGKITSQHGLFYNYLLQSVGIKEAKQYLDANEQAIKNIAKIIEEEKIECDFEWQDNYVFSQNEKYLEKIKKEQEALEYLDFKNSELVYNIDILLKPKVVGAIKFKNQAQFNAYLYGVGIAKKIQEYGGVIFENSKVVDVNKKNNEYEVFTEHGKIKTNKLVIATHYPIVNFPGFYFMKMYQETSYLIACETNDKLFNGMYINEEENETISFRTAKFGNKRLFIVGGMSHKTGAKIDLSNSYKRLEKVAETVYPGCKVLFRWNAEDCVSLDKIPYIGEFSNLWPNVYVATGYKKWGMTSSNVAAYIIANKILEIKNEYEDVFTSTRLKPIKNYKEFGNMLKEVSYSLIINKLKDEIEFKKDLKQGEGKIVEIEGKKVGVYRDEQGKLFAVKPYCSHLGCELSWNNLEKTWDCPCHGSRFTYDGKSIYDPSIRDLEIIYIE